MFSDLKGFTESIRKGGQLPNLIIADIRLSDGSFLSFFSSKESKEILSIPCLVVSSVDDADVIRLCYDRGKSDYITKPFGKAELIVKIERMLAGKKPQRPSGDLDLDIDYASLTVVNEGLRSESLTSKEFQIISALSESQNQSLVRTHLMTKVWGEISVQSKTLDVHLYNLRQKLEPIGLEIRYVAPHKYVLSGNGMNN